MGLEQQEGLRPPPVAIRPQANLGGASGPGGPGLAPRLPSLCRWISRLVICRVQASNPAVSSGHPPRAPGPVRRVVTYSMGHVWQRSADLRSCLLPHDHQPQTQKVAEAEVRARRP